MHDKAAIWPRIEAFEHAFLHITYKIPDFETVLNMIHYLKIQNKDENAISQDDFITVLTGPEFELYYDDASALWQRFLVYSQCIHDYECDINATMSISDLTVLLVLQLYYHAKSRVDVVSSYNESLWVSPKESHSATSKTSRTGSTTMLNKKRLDSRTILYFVQQYFIKILDCFSISSPIILLEDLASLNLILGVSGCSSASNLLSQSGYNIINIKRNFEDYYSWHNDRHPHLEPPINSTIRIIRRSFAITDKLYNEDTESTLVPFYIANVHRKTDIRTADLFYTIPQTIPIIIRDCEISTIVVRIKSNFVSISNCTKCEIFLPDITSCVSMYNCSNIRLFTATGSLYIDNVYESFVSHLTSMQTILTGDCVKLTFSPYCCIGYKVPKSIYGISLQNEILSISGNEKECLLDSGNINVYNVIHLWKQPLLSIIPITTHKNNSKPNYYKLKSGRLVKKNSLTDDDIKNSISFIDPYNYRPRIIPASEWCVSDNDITNPNVSFNTLFLSEEFAEVFNKTMKNMRNIQRQLKSLPLRDREKILNEVIKRCVPPRN